MEMELSIYLSILVAGCSDVVQDTLSWESIEATLHIITKVFATKQFPTIESIQSNWLTGWSSAWKHEKWDVWRKNPSSISLCRRVEEIYSRGLCDALFIRQGAAYVI